MRLNCVFGASQTPNPSQFLLVASKDDTISDLKQKISQLLRELDMYPISQLTSRKEMSHELIQLRNAKGSVLFDFYSAKDALDSDDYVFVEERQSRKRVASPGPSRNESISNKRLKLVNTEREESIESSQAEDQDLLHVQGNVEGHGDDIIKSTQEADASSFAHEQLLSPRFENSQFLKRTRAREALERNLLKGDEEKDIGGTVTQTSSLISTPSLPSSVPMARRSSKVDIFEDRGRVRKPDAANMQLPVPNEARPVSPKRNGPPVTRSQNQPPKPKATEEAGKKTAKEKKTAANEKKKTKKQPQKKAETAKKPKKQPLMTPVEVFKKNSPERRVQSGNSSDDSSMVEVAAKSLVLPKNAMDPEVVIPSPNNKGVDASSEEPVEMRGEEQGENQEEKDEINEQIDEKDEEQAEKVVEKAIDTSETEGEEPSASQVLLEDEKEENNLPEASIQLHSPEKPGVFSQILLDEPDEESSPEPEPKIMRHVSKSVTDESRRHTIGGTAPFINSQRRLPIKARKSFTSLSEIAASMTESVKSDASSSSSESEPQETSTKQKRGKNQEDSLSSETSSSESEESRENKNFAASTLLKHEKASNKQARRSSFADLAAEVSSDEEQQRRKKRATKKRTVKSKKTVNSSASTLSVAKIGKTTAAKPIASQVLEQSQQMASLEKESSSSDDD